jgi:N-carbamoyl-L-amino-acid hydrolase
MSLPSSPAPVGADRALAARLFDELHALSQDPPGVTRDAYGPGEQKAHDLMSRVAAELGLDRAVDAAGNLFLTLAGENPDLPVWLIGSHLDSVPHGGNFDGAAGVVAGMSIVSGLRRAGRRPRRGITVVATRAEESNWFPASYIGSRSALGLLPADILDLPRSDTHRPLRRHMLDLGFAPDRVAAGEAHLTPAKIHAYLELHIEQGPVLEEQNVPLGPVTAISGSFRYRNARCLGVYGHSGAVPRRSRQDAVLAVSELVVALDRLWEAFDRAGRPATVTVGQFATDPTQHGFSKISGQVTFCIDVRSTDPAVVEELHTRTLDLVGEITARRGVRFDLGERTGSRPAAMDPHLRRALEDIAGELGIGSHTMPSFAGHDAATYANAGIPTAMLFVRNQNGSHNPDEQMRLEDFHAATDVAAVLLSR